MDKETVLHTNIEGLRKIREGKVRDIYEFQDDALIIVSTDRLSAYDAVLEDGIPQRGEILTGMSIFWFDYFEDLINSHLREYRINELPDDLQESQDVLKNRFMLVDKAERIDVECIVRGYLAGSGWRMYKENGEINEIKLPTGLKESEKLSEPLFTPTIKAESGHDEPLTFEEMKDEIGTELSNKLRDKSIEIYTQAANYAEKKDIIIADTKFEFGFIDGELSLIDEILSPDSSRFWSKESWEPGCHQKAYDKQYVRDYLADIGWTGDGDPPELPDEVVDKTFQRYYKVFRKLVPHKYNFFVD